MKLKFIKCEASKQSRGKLMQNIIKLEENEKVSVIMPVDKEKKRW